MLILLKVEGGIIKGVKLWGGCSPNGELTLSAPDKLEMMISHANFIYICTVWIRIKISQLWNKKIYFFVPNFKKQHIRFVI